MKTERVIRALGPDPGLTDKDFERLWGLNKQGDPEGTFIAVAYAIRAKRLLNGDPITIDLLIERYKDHMKHNGETYGTKYISRIKNWVESEKYNHVNQKPSNPRAHRYL